MKNTVHKRAAKAAMTAAMLPMPFTFVTGTNNAPRVNSRAMQSWISYAQYRVPFVRGQIHWDENTADEGPRKQVQGNTRGGNVLGVPEGPLSISMVPGQPYYRAALLHELGHSYDRGGMSEQLRQDFLSVMGLKGHPWRGGVNSPHEKFAEAYSAIALGQKYDPNGWAYDFRPTRAQYTALKQIFHRYR